MAYEIQYILRREHLGFKMEFLLEFVVVYSRVSGDLYKHCMVFLVERKRLADPGSFHSDRMSCKLDSCRGLVKLHDFVFQAKLSEIFASFFYRHNIILSKPLCCSFSCLF